MILLKDLLAPWFHYAGSEAVAAPTLDSRAVTSGGLFVAIPGHHSDGRNYVAAAFAKGATAALLHTDDPGLHGQVDTESGLCIHFFQLGRQVSALAAQYYQLQPRTLKIAGVTGTNGKTSVTQLMAQLSERVGIRAAVMGTLGNGLWGELIDSGNTTADAIRVMADLQAFQSAGAGLCAMEVSSHGLVQGRVEAVPFDVAVFTNLSRDHLDYHGDMLSYGAAKRRLFSFGSLHRGIINADDPVGQQWLQELGELALGYSTVPGSVVAYGVIAAEFHQQGIEAQIRWPGGEGKLSSQLLGEFNLANLLAALAALHQLGYDMQQLLAATPGLTPVPGRMECFPAGDVAMVVDYAHTPDAVEQALKAARRHCRGQLWCLFGCGGDRDKGKRPLMAAAAERWADRLLLTSDNARSEDPLAIIADMQAGLSEPGKALVEADRIQAVQLALSLAKPGDLILLAGKGHETYQEIAGVKHDYDERAYVQRLAKEQQ
ncbi:UDP-N-acetylmuramoyl-L-alanyl-D-glutamate--2,6-diaminopimelate ligase [Shewanella sedimentimangrovi]|uniref:UDP-N-acetylmuramyl-tripeptide synthetase n=1 Tax=Shewanella sedimentimangrovi TaxID=2814293 RepID=A0ABX7R1N4_9GAMM|nr:UDP-N-acetylmuramoyl-L-alanyl-D-glutamate--2,6-diaminopimelate ligase [Shewanella sedimentimangrovi]QSX37599.1 UDP-N-acetylmuramoyl-L-alanyl-D-glutamate--2,6-diaminopimelate ligase [Shewanella sedimentimangrovi]